MGAAPITISADDVNALVYAYFQDSGFQHSAFCLNVEAGFGPSHRDTYVRRGQLVDLLSKALLYTEVESHWRADVVTTTCQTPFSLLKDHVCSPDATQTPVPVLEKAAALKAGRIDEIHIAPTSALGSSSVKRKASESAVVEAPLEKRARTSTPMDGPNASPLNISTIPAEAENQQQNIDFSTSGDRNPPSKPALDPYAIQRLDGHRAEVFVCAWNPKHPHLLASGDKGAVVHIWSIPDRLENPNAVPPGPVAFVRGDFKPKAEQADLTALDWSPDGELLAVGSYDSELRIITSAGELYFSHPQHQGPIFAARFSKSGKWLLTGSLDGTACVWDIKEKKLVTMYRCHLDCCLDVDWIDDDTFVSCGADKLINVMRVGESKPLRTLSGHTNEVNQVRYNEHNMLLATCSDDRTARVWDLTTLIRASSPTIPGLGSSAMESKVLIGHKNNVSTVDWCPRQYPGENYLLATSGFDGTTRIWDSGTGNCLKVFSDHKTPVFSISFSPDGYFLTTGGGDGRLHVYDMKTRQRLWTWSSENSENDYDKQGIFEIDWQQQGGLDMIAMTLESMDVCVVDATKIPELRDTRIARDTVRLGHA